MSRLFFIKGVWARIQGDVTWSRMDSRSQNNSSVSFRIQPFPQSVSISAFPKRGISEVKGITVQSEALFLGIILQNQIQSS